MRISPLMVPFVLVAWQQNPELNPEGYGLTEMLLAYSDQLTRIELPDHDVKALEAEAMTIMAKNQQVAPGRQHEVA